MLRRVRANIALEPTGLYRRSIGTWFGQRSWFPLMAGFASATRRLSFTVSVRHEVVQVAVVIVVSSELTAIRRGTTRFSATGILPGHASLVTVGWCDTKSYE